MKTKEVVGFYDNGNAYYRFHLTEDGLYHGLDETFNSIGTLWCIRYWHMDKPVKLLNNYLTSDDIINIRYYI